MIERVEEMKVIKRDGKIVDYDSEKIRIAIGKANNEVKGKDKVSKAEIEEIIKYIEELNKKRILVEDIQDIIEEIDEFVSSLDNDVSLQNIFITVIAKNEIVAVVLDAQTLNQSVSLSGFEIISS